MFCSSWRKAVFDEKVSLSPFSMISNMNSLSETLICKLFLHVACSATLIIPLWSIGHLQLTNNFATCPSTFLPSWPRRDEIEPASQEWPSLKLSWMKSERDIRTKHNQKMPSNECLKILFTCAGKQHLAKNFLLGSPRCSASGNVGSHLCAHLGLHRCLEGFTF